jgi:hypothetical protein
MLKEKAEGLEKKKNSAKINIINVTVFLLF